MSPARMRIDLAIVNAQRHVDKLKAKHVADYSGQRTDGIVDRRVLLCLQETERDRLVQALEVLIEASS